MVGIYQQVWKTNLEKQKKKKIKNKTISKLKIHNTIAARHTVGHPFEFVCNKYNVFYSNWKQRELNVTSFINYRIMLTFSYLSDQ